MDAVQRELLVLVGSHFAIAYSDSVTKRLTSGLWRLVMCESESIHRKYDIVLDSYPSILNMEDWRLMKSFYFWSQSFGFLRNEAI